MVRHLKMAKSAFKALYKYLVWRKCQHVSKGVMRKRKWDCLACRHIKRYNVPFEVFHLKCTKCSCFINLKVWCIDETCPIGRW